MSEPTPSVIDTIKPMLTDPKSVYTMLGLAAASGAAGGLAEADVKGSPTETPAQRRMRILKNSLLYAGAGGAVGAAGITGASLLSSTAGTTDPSPMLSTLTRDGVLAGLGAGGKYLHRISGMAGAAPKAQLADQFATNINEKLLHLSKKLPLNKTTGRAGFTGADFAGLKEEALVKKLTSLGIAADSPETINLMREAGLDSPRGILRAPSGTPGIRSRIPWADRKTNTLNTVKRNKGSLIAGGLAGLAPHILDGLMSVFENAAPEPAAP